MQKLNTVDHNEYLDIYEEAPLSANTEQNAIIKSLYYSLFKDFDSASKQVITDVEANTLSPLYWYTMTQVHLANNDLEAAADAGKVLSDFELVSISQVPVFASTIENSAGIEARIKFLEAQRQQYPLNIEIKTLSAMSYLRNNQAQKSLDILNGIAKQSHSENSLLGLAESFLRTGNVQKAEQVYRDTHTRFNSEITAIRLANFYAQLEKQGDMKAILSQYISAHDDKAVNARLMLAGVSNQTEAIALYKRALTIQPTNTFALNNLAWELHLSGDSESALRYAKKAYQLAPNDVQIATTLDTVNAAVNKD